MVKTSTGCNNLCSIADVRVFLLLLFLEVELETLLLLASKSSVLDSVAPKNVPIRLLYSSTHKLELKLIPYRFTFNAFPLLSFLFGTK